MKPPPRPPVRRVPVAAGYRPGYPRRLDREQFRLLMARGLQGRLRKLLVAGGTALAAAAVRAQEPAAADPSAREAKVLDILRESASRGTTGWYWSSTFRVKGPDARAQSRTVVPNIPIMFGNSQCGIFDMAQARSRALELFRAYGLEAEADLSVRTREGSVIFDGADAARKIAFKLEGVSGTGDWGPVAKEEPPERGMDDAEAQRLRSEGWRIHAAGGNDFRVMDHDTLVPTLAWVAGVVDFLNGVTDGPEVELANLLFGWRQRFACPALEALELSEGNRKENGRYGPTLVIEQPQTLVFRFGRPGDPPPVFSGRSRDNAVSETLDGPISTQGRPSVLEAPLAYSIDMWPQPSEAAAPKFRLVQAQSVGKPPLVLESRSSAIFTPSVFDPARPFELEVQLERGRYAYSGAVIVATVPD